eukprot:36547_1
MRASRRLLICVKQSSILSRHTYSYSNLLPSLSYTTNHNHNHLFRSFCTSSNDNNNNNTNTPPIDDIETEIETETETEAEIPDMKPTMNETVETENLSKHTFQAETRQLLDIVSNSLYTDKEVFLRELLSNASDAMEKARYNVTKDSSKILNSELPLEINVFTDKEKGQIIIQDTGIGMNEEELIDNIGTIARSGSKAFVRSLSESGTPSSGGTGDHIIGQFGVGFYSVFMVCDNVEVYSQSAHISNKDNGWYWVSDGTGSYSMARATNVERGTKIVINLKPDLIEEFADKNRIEGIIKKYSSYLEYPIKLNGSLITSSGAIWSRQPKDVKESEHKEFYQLISNRYDDPLFTYHSHFDSAKFAAQVLIYFPSTHEEKFGAGRMKPGLNIYCKKVLVKKNAPEIIPDWLRFVKGAVDSENIPIHISRENMQDSTLIKQLQESIMMKIVDYLKRQSNKDSEKYIKWFNEFGGFIKEGVCTDYQNRSRIANLLRFETSKTESKQKKSLEDYVNEMKDGQDEIYYLIAPNRRAAMDSPYMEAFLENDTEVLLCFAQIDEFCMKNLGTFKSKNIIGIESSTAIKKDDNKNIDTLSEDNCRKLGKWLKNKFPKYIEKCEPTYRLNKHPSVLVDHQSAAIRQYLNALGEDIPTPPQRIQINPNHNIIKGLYEKITNDDPNAMIIARQMINNSFIAAGMADDPREMIKDMNCVMEIALGYAPDMNDVKFDQEEDKPNIKPEGMDYEQEIVDKMNQEIEDAGLNINDAKTMKNLEIDADVDDVEVIQQKTNDKKTNQ